MIETRAFEESPAISVEATLNEFPQFAPSAGAASVDPASDGLATVSLRGLGANRTLVLLDGRRLVPADGLGQVDLNVLAPELVESVDVVTGGASAVVVYPAFKLPARNYLDVGVAYSFGAGALQGLVLRVGVENLLDEQAPIYPTYQQANTEPALYDVLGKRYYLSAAWGF